MNKKVYTPGDSDDAPPPRNKMERDGKLHNVHMTPEEIALEREDQLRAKAISSVSRPDLAPMPNVDEGYQAAEMTVDGETVRVIIPKKVVNREAEKFGTESKLPKGTAVREDGTICTGREEPWGYVVDIKTDAGILVNRVVPVSKCRVIGTAGEVA